MHEIAALPAQAAPSGDGMAGYVPTWAGDSRTDGAALRVFYN